MQIIRRFLIPTFVLWYSAAEAQRALDPAGTRAALKQHISTLASDRFEGRETGTRGEKLAYEYLVSRFKETGLMPKGEKGYLQPFSFTSKTVMGEGCRLKLNGKPMKAGDWFPLAYSANATVKGTVVKAGHGLVAPTLDYDDYRNVDVKGNIALVEWAAPDGQNPHSRYAEFSDVRTRIDKAVENGATGIIFVNTNPDVENPAADYKHKITPSDIPVIFLTDEGRAALNQGDNLAECTVELKKVSQTGHNVIGYLDNQAATTVVIGAHYDHLGYGDDGSLYRGEPAIHNGADDNASGTAALIELARNLKSSEDNHNNYLFIAFSGEEKGLLGSNHFVKNPTIDLETVNYMLNMDMVGRLKPDERTLQVLGAGTSTSWEKILNGLDVDSVSIKESESGVGPSDHTSFYLKDIPVLHFFTGSHPDYHKPGDDEDKINYDGELSVMKIILAVIHRADGMGRLAFTKTKDADSQSVPKFTVTLGVVPDYAFEGQGMRIDGVSDDRPAARAGLKAGDIVIQIGDHKVVDMMSYMKALSKFSKGDVTVVKVKRGDGELDAEVTF